MILASILPNSELVPYTRLSRSTLYYHPKQPEKDWSLKCQIEEALHTHPSYGHKRLAIELKRNKKAVLRVMKLFGLHPYRRRGKKPFKTTKPSDCLYPNLLLTNYPSYENHIWVADFTLGDSNRFETLGELVYEIYRLIWDYNNTRIHSAFKMPPAQFAEVRKSDIIKLMERVS